MPASHAPALPGVDANAPAAPWPGEGDTLLDAVVPGVLADAVECALSDGVETCPNPPSMKFGRAGSSTYWGRANADGPLPAFALEGYWNIGGGGEGGTGEESGVVSGAEGVGSVPVDGSPIVRVSTRRSFVPSGEISTRPPEHNKLR